MNSPLLIDRKLSGNQTRFSLKKGNTFNTPLNIKFILANNNITKKLLKIFSGQTTLDTAKEYLNNSEITGVIISGGDPGI